MKKLLEVGLLLIVFFSIVDMSLCDEKKAGKLKEYSVEPAVVEMSGVIVSKKVWGPPDYGEKPNSKKVTIYLLKLDEPVDVKGNKADEISTMDFKGVTEVQIFDSKVRVKKFLNKKVVVKGTLHEKSAGAEYTDVLINVKSVKTL